MLPAEAKTLIANIGSLVDQLEQLGEGEAAGAPEEDEEEEVKVKVSKSLDKVMELITDLSEEEKAALMAALNVSSEEPAEEPAEEPEEGVTISKQEGSTASDGAEERIEDQTTINEESLEEIEKAVDASKSLVEAGVLRWASKNEGKAMQSIAKAMTGLAKVVGQQAEAIHVMEMKVGAYDEAFGITDEVVKKSLEGIQGGNGTQKPLKNSGRAPVESVQETLRVLKDALGTGGTKGQEEPGDSGLQHTKRQEQVRKDLVSAMGQGGIFGSRV